MTSQAPFATIRRLTTAIDTPTQDLLDAHGFAFQQLAAGSEQATASFTTPAEGMQWRLDLASQPDGGFRLELSTTAGQQIALTMMIGAMAIGAEGKAGLAGQSADGMAGAVALAMSLVATTAQLAPRHP